MQVFRRGEYWCAWWPATILYSSPVFWPNYQSFDPIIDLLIQLLIFWPNYKLPTFWPNYELPIFWPDYRFFFQDRPAIVGQIRSFRLCYTYLPTSYQENLTVSSGDFYLAGWGQMWQTWYLVPIATLNAILALIIAGWIWRTGLLAILAHSMENHKASPRSWSLWCRLKVFLEIFSPPKKKKRLFDSIWCSLVN